VNPLNVLVAPDSFKEALSADQVSDALEEGLTTGSLPLKVTKLPLADGGEGTVPSLLRAVGGHRVSVEVTGPLYGSRVEAVYAVLKDGTAVMEMASASGLALVAPAKRNPLKTTTYGTGELLRRIVEDGHRQLIMGVGGSATVDGGLGALQALGVRLFDAGGEELPAYPGVLLEVHALDTSGICDRFQDVELCIACDVDNPLVGDRGAAAVFGPQKGATPEQVELLSAALDRLGRLYEKECGRSVRKLPGSGAAGGLSAALYAVLGASPEPGIDLILRTVRFAEHLESADVVVTGEGRFDSQTTHGKVAAGVARWAREAGKPVIVVTGEVVGDADWPAGVSAVVPIQDAPMTLGESIERAQELVSRTGYRIARLLEVGMNLRDTARRD